MQNLESAGETRSVVKSARAEAECWRFESRPYGLGDLVALLVWTAAIVFFFWDVVSFHAALFYFDITEINFPYREFFASELRAGRFSRWCPGLYCGMPLYSESQAGYLHPLKYLLYPWMATWKAFNLDTVVSVWLTGAGTYGWLRRHVGPKGALTGAAVFGLSGFVWAHLIHTSMANALASVPFVVWATEYAWDRGRLAGVAIGASALAFQVFAGHLQDTLLTSILLGVYAAFRALTETNARDRIRVLAIAASVIALGAGLAAVQWIPSKELLDRSPRADGLTWNDLIYGSWHPELLPTLVVREAYGTRARDTDWMDGFYPYHEMNAYLGLTALALAVIGGAAYRDRWVAFWVMLAGVGTLLMLGKHTFLFDFAHKIPILGSSRIPVRFHLWVSLAVAALAAVGVDRLDRAFPVKLRRPVLLVVILFVASIPILVYVYLPVFTHPARWNKPYHLDRYRWLGRELVVATLRTGVLISISAAAVLTAVRTRSGRVRQVACSVLPLVVMADLLGSHWSDVPTIAPSYWTTPPLSAQRIKDDPDFVRLSSLRFYTIGEKSAGEPGYASTHVDFLSARDTLGWSLPPIWGLASDGGETPIIPRRRLAFTDHVKLEQGRLDLESVTHVLSNRGKLDLPQRGVPAGVAFVYKNSSAFPRARIMGHPYYVKDQAGALAAVRRLGPALRDRLVVEEPSPTVADAEVSGTARITVDLPELVEVEVETPSPAYLVLADSFDPGWTATLGGQSVPIRPAWIAFRAVEIPSGKQTIVFRYRPAGFTAGLTISLVSLVIAVILIAWPRPLKPFAPAHAATGWSSAWPWWGAVAFAVIVLVSTVSFDREGKPIVSERWSGSLHDFTWGAGYKAIKPRLSRE